ncbi:hypothetical protein [Nitrobacter sp. TKz-YC02]|uniref:hypothetical protein n=1 Tax=Nitrobacter sp. TKz-YC02 TaxID=3398704 RepID=UPI003CF7615C
MTSSTNDQDKPAAPSNKADNHALSRRNILLGSFSEQRMQGTMGLWTEPFTTLRLQKIFNLFQDPFERADFTSNTFWDWQLDHVGFMYGVMDEVFQFAASFKDFPPRSFPPSVNPANILESEMDGIKRRESFKKNFDLDRIRGGLNRIIDEQIQQRGVK